MGLTNKFVLWRGGGGEAQYVTVARAEILASGPAHFAYKHNDNFKRKEGMSRASPVKRAKQACT